MSGRGLTCLLVPLVLLVLGACGEDSGSSGEFADPPEPRERPGEVTAPGARDPERGPPAGQSGPRTARIGVWSMPRRDWPLTVSEGVVRCRERDGRAVVTFVTPDARVYAVNGAAVAQGLARIDPIRRRDSELPGEKADLSPVLEQGLRLCE